MTSREVPINFLCGKQRLYGILHQPAHPSERGLLLLSGRPALRTGRHRLLVLLARAWAEAGVPVMRFDSRGSGDSEGEMGTLEEASADIASAIDAFLSNVPGLQQIVLWGLCGGATDSILYAPTDKRVAGIVIVNPWFYDARLRTLATVRRRASHYLGKLRKWFRSPAPGKEKSSKALPLSPSSQFTPTGELDLGAGPDVSLPLEATVDRAYCSYRVPDLSKRLAEGLQHFTRPVLLILSGQDKGAQAFKHNASISLKWRRLLSEPRVQRHELPNANHSLRLPQWREQVAAWTLAWLREKCR